MILFTLAKTKTRDHDTKGTCANCKAEVWESQFTLDDCYNVWAGKCPHCDAVNLLALTSLRGYSSQGMDLVLPFDEEIEENEVLQKIDPKPPSQGRSGKPCDMKGTVAGTLYDILLNPSK